MTDKSTTTKAMSDNEALKRSTRHPGVVLEYDFLRPMEMSVDAACERLGLRPQYFKACVAGSLTFLPETLHAIAKLVGTTPFFWFDLQDTYARVHGVETLRPQYGQVQSLLAELSNLCLHPTTAFEGTWLIMQTDVQEMLLNERDDVIRPDLLSALFLSKNDQETLTSASFATASLFSRETADTVLIYVKDTLDVPVRAVSYEDAIKMHRALLAKYALALIADLK